MLVGSFPLVLALLAPPVAVDRATAMRTMNEGVDRLQHGDSAGAETALARATELDPGLSYAWLNLGHYYRKVERLEDAAMALRAGIPVAERPVKAELQAQLGRVLLEQASDAMRPHAKRMAAAAAAVPELEAAVAAEPHRVRTLLRIARAHELLEAPEQADAAYRRAIAIDPSCSPAYVGLAMLYIDYGYPRVAVLVLQEDTKRNPEQVDAWIGLGRAYQALDDHVQSVEAFDKALTLDPDVPEAYFGLGMAHAELRHRKEAVAALERYLSIASSAAPEKLRAANNLLARMKDTP